MKDAEIIEKTKQIEKRRRRLESQKRIIERGSFDFNVHLERYGYTPAEEYLLEEDIDMVRKLIKSLIIAQHAKDNAEEEAGK